MGSLLNPYKKREEVGSERWMNLAKAAQLRRVTKQHYIQEPACDHARDSEGEEERERRLLRT